jgi:putative methyltransferase
MKNVYIVVLNQVPFLPYIYGLLRVYAEQDPDICAAYKFQEPFFLMQSPGEIAARIESPAVLGLSCYVWNFHKQMKIARICKEQNPDTLVVAGGPHIPEQLGNFFTKYPYVDLLVHNEGEIAFQRILKEAISSIPDWSKIPGISFIINGKIVQTGQGEKLPREINLPSPYLAGYLDGAIAACRERNLRFYAPWETNRGCPYSCSFCDWGSSTMSLMRKFSDQRLAQEIEFFGRARISNIFICDANFGILPRDLEFGQALARTHQFYGFPLQVRVNFAKNSNDRVFAISKVWSKNDMLMGTTLSMQSTNLDVLEAIDRKNIGIKHYQALKERYAQAGIPTYTELILGLPLETQASFKEGIGSLLEAGNHDDIRVYEFVILPNAPINQPTILERFGIKTIEKQMYLEPADTSSDEVETVQLVMETKTMSQADWVNSALFAQLIQILHNGCYTRYLAIHLRHQYGLPFYTFYDRLEAYFLENPDMVLGQVLRCLRDLYERYLEDPHIPQVNLIASQP